MACQFQVYNTSLPLVIKSYFLFFPSVCGSIFVLQTSLCQFSYCLPFKISYQISQLFSFTSFGLYLLMFSQILKQERQISDVKLFLSLIYAFNAINVPLRNAFSSVQSLSRVQLFATPWTAARQASLSITNSRSLLKLMSIESVMLYNHLVLCHPLLLLPSIFPSIGVFSNESVLHIKQPKYWSFRFSISPSFS